jgi:myo-inositol-hexaphosphate 3-phosphohydrolase
LFQQANQFRIFTRQGKSKNKHDHVVEKMVKTVAIESDGNEVGSLPLPGFPNGIFVE